MPQCCKSNTPSASSQNTYSRQLKHPAHVRNRHLKPRSRQCVQGSGVADLLFLFSFLALTFSPQVGSAQTISLLLSITHQKSDWNMSVKFQKGPTLNPTPTLWYHKHGQPPPHPHPPKLLSYLNPDGCPDCSSRRSGSALQCVGNTPPADMCAKVSGFAFLVQARTCGRGQRCNFWRQKKLQGSMCTTAATRGKNVQVGYHSGFLSLFLNKMEMWWHHHQAAGDSVRLTPKNPSPLHRPPIYQTLLLYSVSIVKKSVWRPHLTATELTHSTTTQEHPTVQWNSSPQTLFISKQ